VIFLEKVGPTVGYFFGSSEEFYYETVALPLSYSGVLAEDAAYSSRRTAVVTKIVV
jgi:hypothetical protein